MRLHLNPSFVDALIEKAMETPYTPIPAEGRNAGAYMERYWLVPYDRPSQLKHDLGTGPLPFRQRPFSRLLQKAGVSARVHHIKSSDPADAFHDHPWWFLSVILRGGYREYVPMFEHGEYVGEDHNYYEAGSVLFRTSLHRHRLELESQTAWTLFICGPESNEWGFFPIMERDGREYLLSKVRAAHYTRNWSTL